MKKIGSGFYFALFFVIFKSAFLFAENSIELKADVDQDRVSLGDTFVVTVSIQSSESVNIDEPQLPQLSGLALLGKDENTSVQQSLISTPQGMDWKTLRKKNFFYRFQAAQVGRIQLDPIEVVINGKLFQTRPILVEVLPEGQRPAPQVPQESEEESLEDRFLREQDEIFNQLLRRHLMPQVPQVPNAPRGQKAPEYRSLPTNPNEAFFIQLEVDKTSVYEGEQVTATWYLVTRGQMETLDRAKFPALKGFWKEIIEENPQIQFYEEVINGVPYRKALMATHALFPIRAGKAIIDEFTVKSRIRLPTAGFGMGFGRAYEYTKSSKRLELKVKPLPLDGRPAEFTGAVGNFEVLSQLESGPQFYVNQPVSLKVRFEGEGNAKTLELPMIQWPEGFELYDTKNESRFFKDGRSYKEFQILVIPRKEGPLQIPEIRFAYFNPKTEKYESKTSPAIMINVLPETQNKVSESKNFLGFQIEPQKPKVMSLPPLQKIFQQQSQRSQVSGSVWLGAFSVVFLGLFGFAGYTLRPKSRTLNLRNELQKKFSIIRPAAKKGDYRKTGIEVVNIINFLLAEVTSHKGEKLEIEKMIAMLPPELRAQCGVQLANHYDKAQIYGFAPESAINQSQLSLELPQFVKESEVVIFQVCDAWKPKGTN
ncbi:MAG: BatD family protein [Bdellovibrionales bacterium]